MNLNGSMYLNLAGYTFKKEGPEKTKKQWTKEWRKDEFQMDE